MRIFLAGATGAVGRRLVPALVGAGHEVFGTTRGSARAGDLRAAGAEPVVLDPLDRDAVMAAVAAAKPEVVMHQLTALGNLKLDFKRFDREFAQTNLLRTKGLDYLLAAAQAAGARRFVAQSFTGWPNERTGGPVKTEDDPLDPTPTAASRESHAAIRYLESAVTGGGIEGLALRYGGFYGPGTGFERGGAMVEMVRQRKLPIVGGGTGIWSFVHMDDVTSATVAAVEHGTTGLYNIVDDEPAPVAEWLPYLAEVLGARPPRRVPAWLVRPMLGEHGVSAMTATRGSSNARAKRELGWKLRYPSWREGFRTGLG
ncbi:MAG: NAD-dependent epimerase/dehydratase family protein [Micromonosporaceae bacterium]|nr:NAD-dependent epimerase/dehydratase family protein [Micromonosporaceae bacterium]